jgi:hypothetical protein
VSILRPLRIHFGSYNPGTLSPTEIINSFLHYLQQYSILSEPVFTSQLANVCSLSRKYLRAMTSAGMIYEMSVKRDGWIGLAVSTWVKNITEEWNDEGWKKLGVENWEEDAKAHEMEFAAKLELAKEAGSGEVEVDGNKENAKAEEWDGDAACESSCICCRATFPTSDSAYDSNTSS